MEVVDTRLYDPDTFDELLTRLEGIFDDENQPRRQEATRKSCCAAKKAEGLDPCCDTNPAQSRTLQSEVSTVVLPVASETRHSSRFGISSFLYRARRPFHPDRFTQEFVNKFFVFHDPCEDDSEGHDDEVSGSANGDETEYDDVMEQDEGKKLEPKPSPEELQRMACDRQEARTKEMGQLMRSKGFLWLAHMHDLRTTFSHAGNLVTLTLGGLWTALESKAYRGTKEEKSKLCKNWVAPWADRRQELLVFIGQNLNHKFIQGVVG